MTDAELAIVVKLKDMFSKQLDSIVKSTDKSTKQMEGSWKKLTMGITAAKVAVAGWLTGQVAQGVKSIAEFTAKIDRANVAFGSMSQRIGVDATEAINVMREASGGAVSDLDLMAAANRAIMLGAVKTTEELRNLTYYGAKLGNAMGLAASQGIDYFTTGLARQSNAILDNVGLIIDLEGEYKKLGKTAADLTEDERRSIFGTAVWRQAQESVKALGDKTATFANEVDRLSAAWENLKGTMAKGAAPAAASVAEGLNAWMKTWGFESVAEFRQKIDQINAERRAAQEPIDFFGTEEDERAMRTSNARRAIEAGNKRSRELAEKRKAFDALESLKPQAPASDAQVIEWQPTSTIADHVNRVWDAMGVGTKRYYDTVKEAMALVSTAVYRAFQDMETSIGDVFFDAMMGKMKSFKDYLKAFLEDISRTLSQFFARAALQQIMGIGASLLATPLSGGLQVYQMHAAGGIADEPSIAGEAGPEAIVPLPGNRKIPVELRGGGDGRAVTLNFNINAVDGASVQRMLAREGKTIAAIIQDALGRDSQLRAAVQGV